MASAPRTPAPTADRLVDVAVRLAAREGIEALTLRRIARGAGVSHGAPLRHFASLADLLSDVAARGFRLLREAIEGSADGLPAGAGALPRLAAAGRAYVRCAVENPGLFALMFRPEALDSANARLLRDSQNAFEQLLRLVRAAQDAGWHEDRDALGAGRPRLPAPARVARRRARHDPRAGPGPPRSGSCRGPASLGFAPLCGGYAAPHRAPAQTLEKRMRS